MVDFSPESQHTASDESGNGSKEPEAPRMGQGLQMRNDLEKGSVLTQKPSPGRPLTPRQLADYYQVSDRHIRRLAAAGMPCRCLGQARRYYVDEVDRWILKRRL